MPLFSFGPLPTNGLSDICLKHSAFTAQHLLKGSTWALRMADSVSKLQSGLMAGNIVDLGNYDECLDVEVNEKWGSFIGQYCLPAYKLNLTVRKMQVPLFRSVCMPSTCTPEDLQYALSKINKNLVVDPLLCHTKTSSRPLVAIDWIVIILFTIIGMMCVISTAYDYIVTDKDRRKKIMLAFSWKTNGRDLFSIEKKDHSMDALYGIRFISMCFIILGHTFAMAIIVPSVNLLPFVEMARTWKYILLHNAIYSVDTFFVLSGMLLCYHSLRYLNAGVKFNIPLFYIHRYIRITPLLGSAILLHVSFIDKLFSGPMSDYVYNRMVKKNCYDNWFYTLLHIQNYMDSSKICVAVSWYLGVDTQLFLISPIFLLSLHKWPRFGLILTTAGVMFGSIATFTMSYIDKSDPNFLRPGNLGNLDKNYFYTHMRCVSWFIGILCGYLLYHTSDWRERVALNKAGLKKGTVILGWALTAVASALVFTSIHSIMQEDNEFDAFTAAFYYTYTRPFWCFSLVWIIFACISGYGGFLNTFLSWNIWKPLGRMTFAMFIFHIDVLMARSVMTKTSIYNSISGQITETLIVILLTIAVSIVFTLAVEWPFAQLEKIMFPIPVPKESTELHDGRPNKLKLICGQDINSEQKIV